MHIFMLLKICFKIVFVISLKSRRITNENAKDYKECGVEASLHPLHRDPWLVLLEYYKREELTVTRCGGTLVDSNNVVTAAHCVKSPKYSHIMVRLGEYNTETEEDCIEEICSDEILRVKVVTMIVHPHYDGKENDIAVLKLSVRVNYTDFIRPICLPGEKFKSNPTFFASGWGEIPGLGVYSDVKKVLPLPYIPARTCRKAYMSKLPERIICAGGEEAMDTCRGDSGGPLTLIRERVELWGVTSLGNERCGEQAKPGLYTSVADYVDWIKAVIDN